MANSLQWHKDEDRILVRKLDEVTHNVNDLKRRHDDAERKMSEAKRKLDMAQRDLQNAETALENVETETKSYELEKTKLMQKIEANNREIQTLEKAQGSQDMRR